MVSINDDSFIGKPFIQQEQNTTQNLTDPNKWAFNKISELVNSRQPTSDGDPLPSGTDVEFILPDKSVFVGKVASKSGEDYIIEVNNGESYLIPPGKLSKISSKEKIAEVISREHMPQIEVIAEHTVDSRHMTLVSYKERRPSDSQIIKWSSIHYPDLRLVDAIDKGYRNLDLIFEIQATESPEVQGGDPNIRGMGLAREAIPGTGVIGEASELSGIDETTIEEGLKVELEHTEDENLARQIAVDHLAEDPEYYKKLEIVEKKSFNLYEVAPVTKVVKFSDVVDTTADVIEVIQASRRFASDVCATLADSVLSCYGGYSAEAHADFDARLTKLAVDPKAKEYWSSYFGEYGKMQTRDVPRKKHKKTSSVSSFTVKVDYGPHELADQGGISPEEMSRFENEGYPDEFYNQSWEIEYESDESEPDVGHVGSLDFLSATNSETGEELPIEEFYAKFNKDYTWLKLSLDEQVAMDAEDDFSHMAKKAFVKQAVDKKTKDYWTKYFGSGSHNDGWYGKLLVRDIPRKKYAQKESESDCIAFIEKVNDGYEVKSEKNSKWSGGTYKSKDAAEERLKEIEMFKHMGNKIGSFADSDHELLWATAGADLFGKSGSLNPFSKKYLRPKHQRPPKEVIKNRSYPSQGPYNKDIKSINDLSKWVIYQATNEADYELNDLMKYFAMEWIMENPGKIEIPGEIIGEAFYASITDGSGKAQKKINVLNKFLQNWDERRTTYKHKEFIKQRKKEQEQNIDEGYQRRKEIREDSVDENEYDKGPTEFGDEEESSGINIGYEDFKNLESNEKTPPFNKMSQKEEEDIKKRIKELLKTKPDRLDWTNEEISLVDNFLKKIESKVNPLLVPSTSEEALERSTYKPPDPKPVKENKRKLQKLLSKQKDNIDTQFESTGAEKNIQYWIFPSDHPLFGDMYLWEALYLTNPEFTDDDNQDRKELYNYLATNYPEEYLALLYQTYGVETKVIKDDAVARKFDVESIHKKLEKMHDVNLVVPKHYMPEDTPKVIKPAVPASYIQSNNPEYVKDIELLMKETKENQKEERKKKRDDQEGERSYESIKEHYKNRPRPKIKTVDPLESLNKLKIQRFEEESDEAGEEVAKYIENLGPISPKSKEDLEEEELSKDIYLQMHETEMADETHKLPEAEEAFLKGKLPEGGGGKGPREEEGYIYSRFGRLNKFSSLMLRKLAQSEEDPDEYAMQKADEFADPNSDVNKKYKNFLSWVPKPTRAITKYPYRSIGRISPIYAGWNIEMMLSTKDSRDNMAKWLENSNNPGLSKLLVFALVDNNYMSKEIKKKLEQGARRELKDMPGESFRGKPAPKVQMEKRKPTEYRGPEIIKHKKDKAPSEESSEGVDLAYWKIPEGHYEGKTLGEAYEDADKDGNEDKKADLNNLLARRHTDIWLKLIQYLYKDNPNLESMLELEQKRIERIQTLDPGEPQAPDTKDFQRREKKYLNRRRGEEIIKALSDKNMTLLDAFNLAWDYKENKGEPGVLDYLMYIFKENDKDSYSEFNDYLRNKKQQKSFQEYKQKKMEEADDVFKFKIEAVPPDSPYLGKTILEAEEIAKVIDEAENTGFDERDNLEVLLTRNYPIEFRNFKQNIEKHKQQLSNFDRQQKALDKQIEPKSEPGPKKEILEEAKLVPYGEDSEEYQDQSVTEMVSPKEKERRIKERETRLEKETGAKPKVEYSTLGPPTGMTPEEYEKMIKPDKDDSIEEKKKKQETRDKRKKEIEEESMADIMSKLPSDEEIIRRLKGAFMQRKSNAGPGPNSYNAPGKNDKEDYNYHKRNKQPARNRNNFNIERMYSTTSSDDNGYVIMELSWDPELFAGMSPQNVQHQIISYIKGLESDKYYHDFGIMGKPKIMEFDEDAGVARVKIRCSESRGIMTLSLSGDSSDSSKLLTGLR